MNETDKQFWMGFLEGILAVERKIEAEGIADPERQGDIIKAVRNLKQSVKRLHANDILVFLRKYEDEDTIEIRKVEEED